MKTKNFIAAALIGAWTVVSAGCGGSSSSGDSAPPPPQASNHAIGGSVSDLLGTLVLANNGSDALTVDKDGAFVFAGALATGSAYAVTVRTQPADQLCSVINGSGTVADVAITNILVKCSAKARPVGGSLRGLAPSGQIVLRNNGGDALTLDANGAFVFANAVEAGSAYAVTVQTQPADQTCTVDNGSGTVADAAITNIVINCAAPTRTVGGNLYGLAPSGHLVLRNNGGDALTLGADGAFVFANAVPAGDAYAVTVQTQPANQLCTVSDGAGTIAADNVTNVTVNCSVLTRAVGGTVSGLAPSESVVLQNNSGDDLAVNADGSFVFPVPVAQSGAYAVTVLTQPASQTCSVTNGSGTAGGADITNVQVTCATNAYTVGGTLSGLSGTVVLQNNGADDRSLTSNGAFTFSTPVAQGASYNVTVLTQPVGETCTVTNGSGTMGASNVTNVSLTCTINSTTLSISITDIALSVTGLTEYGIGGTPSSGVARTISVTNTGSDDAVNMTITPPTWPAGTTSSTSCGSTLAAGGSCTIAITPGATASSDGTNPCSSGTAPVPGAIQVSGDNANTVSSNAVILGYGCIYQGGYVYAFDDTTPDTGSVGGNVAATSDQAAGFPNGIIWASNGGAGNGSGGVDMVDGSFDTIPGINENSTTSTGSPSYASFSVYLSSIYTNLNPFTSASFTSCNGAYDGQCNTNNIVTFYNEFITNNTISNGGSPPFTASSGPTPSTYYAAGLCKQTISSYSDWSLPAICELGYGSSACGTDNTPTKQNMQSNLVDFNGLNLLTGNYWSSTEDSNNDTFNAWNQQFSSNGGAGQSTDTKYLQLGVRCSRALTP